jgi:RNA polymerase sigma-70 factor (ECF subfamily)
LSTSEEPLDAALVTETRRRVLGLCRLLLGSAMEAEDAASEVFVRIQSAMAEHDRALPFPQWALAIARNHCLDLLRRRRTQGRIFADEDPGATPHPSPAPSPLGQLLSSEERARVRQALDRLPDRERTALVLRYYEEQDYDQIGRVLDLSRQGAATLVFRAKRALREHFARLDAGGS